MVPRKSQVAENSKGVSVETKNSNMKIDTNADKVMFTADKVMLNADLSVEDLLKLIKNIQEQNKELANKLAKLESEKESSTPIKGEYDDRSEYENITIRPDKYVKVISLDIYPLNLSTEKYGKGRTYRFNEFGHVKNIPFKNLADIVDTHSNFVEDGRFYILNRAAIHELSLEDIYSNILTKEKIDAILQGNDRDVSISLFQSANKAQREVICQMLIDRRINDEEVDLNIWDRIDRMVDGQLEEKYNINREYLDSLDLQKEEQK